MPTALERIKFAAESAVGVALTETDAAPVPTEFTAATEQE